MEKQWDHQDELKWLPARWSRHCSGRSVAITTDQSIDELYSCAVAFTVQSYIRFTN